MADDLDDLLDELEKTLNGSVAETALSSSAKTDDLKDLLDDFEPPPVPLEKGPIISQEGKSVKRCTSPHIGGTSLTLGMTTAATKRSCNHLRCVKCDLPVVFFEGFVWTDDTSYLFLRNNYPDINRLRSHLDSCRGGRAFACQCKCRSAKETLNVDKDEDLHWVCGKH